MNNDKIVCVILGLFVAACVVLLIGCVICEAKNQHQIEICYKQEPRTKDCEFLLWKYENREKTSTVAVPVFIHH